MADIDFLVELQKPAIMSSTSGVAISDSLIRHMSIGKVFKDTQEQILGVDFSADGRQLVAYTETAMHIYDILQAKKNKTLFNRITRISLLRFSNSDYSVIFVPATPPFDLFVWCFYKNEIVKRFRGGPDPVLTLQKSVNDLALTVDSGRVIRVYNLFSGNKPIVEFLFSDKQSVAAGITYDGCTAAIVARKDEKNLVIALHNLETEGKENFRRLVIQQEANPLHLQFDGTGSVLLCCLDSGKALIVNLKGEYLSEVPYIFDTRDRLPGLGFTPDGNFLLVGSPEGAVRIFELKKQIKEIVKLQGHIKSCYAVAFCPSMLVIASACQNLVLWVPRFWDNK